MAFGDWDITNAPEKAPAVDFLTRSAQGPFVDTHIDIEYKPELRGRQRVYLSVETIKYLAQVAGIEGGGAAHSETRDRELIARGKLEGLKEAHGPAMDDLARALHRIADDAGLGGDRLGGAAGL